MGYDEISRLAPLIRGTLRFFLTWQPGNPPTFQEEIHVQIVDFPLLR